MRLARAGLVVVGFAEMRAPSDLTMGHMSCVNLQLRARVSRPGAHAGGLAPPPQPTRERETEGTHEHGVRKNARGGGQHPHWHPYSTADRTPRGTGPAALGVCLPSTLALYQLQARLRVSLAASMTLPALSIGTVAFAVQVAPFSNLLSTYSTSSSLFSTFRTALTSLPSSRLRA